MEVNLRHALTSTRQVRYLIKAFLTTFSSDHECRTQEHRHPMTAKDVTIAKLLSGSLLAMR